MESYDIIGSLSLIVVVLAWAIAKVIKTKAKDKHRTRATVLGISLLVCFGGQAAGLIFPGLAPADVLIKALIVAGGANITYRYIAHPVEIETTKAAKTLHARLTKR